MKKVVLVDSETVPGALGIPDDRFEVLQTKMVEILKTLDAKKEGYRSDEIISQFIGLAGTEEEQIALGYYAGMKVQMRITRQENHNMEKALQSLFKGLR